MISGEYRRLPGGSVRSKRWSNGPPRLWGSARLARVLFRAPLADFLTAIVCFRPILSKVAKVALRYDLNFRTRVAI
jgi:hypothetical protein